MKKLLVLASFVAVVAGCNKKTCELVGVGGREPWYQPELDESCTSQWGAIIWAQVTKRLQWHIQRKSKMVSVQAFYIDDSEISNNEYRQFVYWVRDSIARKLLAFGSNPEAKDFQISRRLLRCLAYI